LATRHGAYNERARKNRYDAFDSINSLSKGSTMPTNEMSHCMHFSL
jgi:hypothetical protein